jgi:hypothetical protein
MAECRDITETEAREIRDNLQLRDGSVYWAKLSGARRRLDRPAGSNVEGYLQIGLSGRIYRAHRIALFLHNGSWPSSQLDHINGIRTDNRPENLRIVTQQENCRNRRPQKNASQYSNIYIYTLKNADKRYQVRVRRGTGKGTYYKTCKNLPDAIMLRNVKHQEFGYHHNHGRLVAV